MEWKSSPAPSSMTMADAESLYGTGELYPRVRVVSSIEELLETPWRDGVNALCLPRKLQGDFAELADRLGAEEGITTLEAEDLEALSLSVAGRLAVAQMLADAELLSSLGLAPELNCINGFYRDATSAAIRTDVSSFHVDSATSPADTFLCTYFGASSEGLPNESATQKTRVPQIRKKLLAEFGGSDGPAFENYLKERCYDLHYEPHDHAGVFEFGVGNLWRIAVKHPGCPVPPCIHRAPDTYPGQKRLLLIA